MILQALQLSIAGSGLSCAGAMNCGERRKCLGQMGPVWKGLKVRNHSHQGDVTVPQGPGAGDWEMGVERKAGTSLQRSFCDEIFQIYFLR